MRALSLEQVLDLHERLVALSGSARGIRDLSVLEACLAQPHATFGGGDLYPDVIAKAAALCFFLVMNHPFVDGNKRVGHAAMETLLILNGQGIACSMDEQEAIMLDLAAGKLSRDAFTQWVRNHTTTT